MLDKTVLNKTMSDGVNRLNTAHDRAQQVIDELRRQNGALSADDRRMKYQKMAASPFAFYRGSNPLYWHDMFRDWHFSLYGGQLTTQTWLQGDAHLHNFGAYGSHDHKIRFGLDDFDDAIIGDYQYDLWRLAISIVLDMRQNSQVNDDDIDSALTSLATHYLETLEKNQGENADWVAMCGTTKGPLKQFLDRIAEKKDRQQMLDKWTHLNDQGERCFMPNHPKMAAPSIRVRKAFTKALEDYQHTLADQVPGHSQQHFKVKDVALRLGAGTGSLGTQRYYALIEGMGEGDHDDVILDIKAQQKPAAWQAMSRDERQRYRQAFTHEGERHAIAFQAMAQHPDVYLGWMSLQGEIYSVRERSPFKADFPTHKLKKGKQFTKMARDWGCILAYSHLRGARSLTPERPDQFAESVLARAGQDRQAFTQLLILQARAYADCVHHDHQVLLHGLASGGLK